MAARVDVKRLFQAALGVAAAARFGAKYVPEGHARSFGLGVGATLFTGAALDVAFGVDILTPLRASYDLAAQVGASQMPRDPELPTARPPPAPTATSPTPVPPTA